MLPKLSFFVILAVTSLAAPCAQSDAADTLYSRLNTKEANWVQLPHDKSVWESGLPVYLAYDKGSLKKRRGVAYVRVKNGERNAPPVTYVMAAKCGAGRMASIALGETALNAGISTALWNNGNVRFSNPGDGGDHTLWRVPSGLEDVDALYAAMCQS